MIEVLVFIGVIVGLYLMRQWISVRLQAIFLLLNSSKSVAISIYSIIFLPGIILHEMAHFLVATFLNVPTGEITLLPKDVSSSDEEKRIALGSVKIAKVDFLRSSLIGIAPIVLGSICLYAIVQLQFKFLLENSFLEIITSIIIHIKDFLSPLSLILIYGILNIANTMFSSKEDSRSFAIVGGLAGLIMVAVALANKTSVVWNSINPGLISISRALFGSMLMALIIDLVFLIILFVIGYILEKLTHKRVLV